MNKKAMAYTLLKNYDTYEILIKKIDEDVLNKATKSHITTYSYGAGYQSIEELSRDIIDLIDKKRHIIDCRTLVLDTLKKLPRENQRILVQKFFKDCTFEVIGESLNVAPAQARREVIKSFKRFCYCMFENEKFDAIYNSEFCFYKPLQTDYIQSVNNERLVKMGIFG